jgi:hypothetical protein
MKQKDSALVPLVSLLLAQRRIGPSVPNSRWLLRVLQKRKETRQRITEYKIEADFPNV